MTMDVVGTLIQPAVAPVEIYVQIASDHGLWADPNALEPKYRDAIAATRWGPDPIAYWYEVIDRTFGRPIPADIKDAILAAFGKPEAWTVLPGAAEVCALPISKAVLSNMDQRLYDVLAGLELGPIDFVVLPWEAGRPKPNEAMMHLACGFLRTTPDKVLHSGDSDATDGELCRRSGATWLRVDPARGPDPVEVRRHLGLDP